jgi:hypothetical protein
MRAARWLLSLTGLLGLVSCSDRLPSAPRVGATATPPLYAATDSTLEANRTLWSSSRIQSYRYRFRWECFCGQDVVQIVEVTVMRGSVVSVVDAVTGKPLAAEAAARYRTIDGLFDFLRQAVDRPANSVRSAFDPKLGYPSAAYVDYVASIADEEMGFRIYALRTIQWPHR